MSTEHSELPNCICHAPSCTGNEREEDDQCQVGSLNTGWCFNFPADILLKAGSPSLQMKLGFRMVQMKLCDMIACWHNFSRTLEKGAEDVFSDATHFRISEKCAWHTHIASRAYME